MGGLSWKSKHASVFNSHLTFFIQIFLTRVNIKLKTISLGLIISRYPSITIPGRYPRYPKSILCYLLCKPMWKSMHASWLQTFTGNCDHWIVLMKMLEGTNTIPHEIENYSISNEKYWRHENHILNYYPLSWSCLLQFYELPLHDGESGYLHEGCITQNEKLNFLDLLQTALCWYDSQAARCLCKAKLLDTGWRRLLRWIHVLPTAGFKNWHYKKYLGALYGGRNRTGKKQNREDTDTDFQLKKHLFKGRFT